MVHLVARAGLEDLEGIGRETGLEEVGAERARGNRHETREGRQRNLDPGGSWCRDAMPVFSQFIHP